MVAKQNQYFNVKSPSQCSLGHLTLRQNVGRIDQTSDHLKAPLQACTQLLTLIPCQLSLNSAQVYTYSVIIIKGWKSRLRNKQTDKKKKNNKRNWLDVMWKPHMQKINKQHVWQACLHTALHHHKPPHLNGPVPNWKTAEATVTQIWLLIPIVQISIE